MKIQVLKRHIMNGKPGDGSCCAVALALHDHLFEMENPHLMTDKYVHVSDDGIQFMGNHYGCPLIVERFINAFDECREVSPFEFDLTDAELKGRGGLLAMIQVKQAHIARGVPGACQACPVALAINEVHPGYVVEVTRVRIYMMGNGFDLRIQAPASVHDFVKRFDDGLPVEPFEFELGV